MTSATGTASARAGTNIALVKYWGKRDLALNLPATGSVSLTLAELGTHTTVRWDPALGADAVRLDGAQAEPDTAARTSRFLDLVRARAGVSTRAAVTSRNSVPTASGLASSASAFAALALAASRGAGLDLGPGDLSALARRGSGSAARSIFGGFAEMQRGSRPDGTDAVARPVPGGDGWALRLVIGLTTRARKAVGSTVAMQRTAATSPYHPAWIDSNEREIEPARDAIAARDLEALGAIAERSCLRMHASAMAADPGILYWNGATVAALHAVRELRLHGTGAWFTVDAGPHVKVLCAAADAPAVAASLAEVPGVLGTLVAAPGPGATLTEEAVA